jgi:hypothetical protein
LKDFLNEKKNLLQTNYLFFLAIQPQGLNSGCFAFVLPPLG